MAQETKFDFELVKGLGEELANIRGKIAAVAKAEHDRHESLAEALRTRFEALEKRVQELEARLG